MREARELNVQPEPLPAGLRFVPPRLPPAPPATGASDSSSSPELHLVALLAPCFQEAVTIGALLQRWEACSAAGQEAPDELARELDDYTHRLATRLSRFRIAASPLAGHDSALRAFQTRLRLLGANREGPGEHRSERSIRDCLIAGASEVGFHHEELDSDEFWSYPAPDALLAMPPKTCLFYLLGALAVEMADPAVLSGSRRFCRSLFRRVATMLLAALEAATLKPKPASEARFNDGSAVPRQRA